MSILDDAIREHLELKRAHGADEGELQRIEDEAFGPPRRPDEVDRFAEAPTEFLLSPSEEPAAEPEIADEDERGGRRPDVADLQEAPPSGPPADLEAPPADFEAHDDAPPPVGEAPADLPPPPAVEEEHPAGEHEIVADHGPDTEERRAIADQPTQMFDVEAEIGEPEAAAEEAPAEEAPEPAPPADPVPAAAEPEEDSGEFDFFDEQRLSEELDQALEAPLDDKGALPGYEEGAADGGVFDFDAERESYEEDPSQEMLRRADAAERSAEEAEDAPAADAPRPAPQKPSEESPRDVAGEDGEEDEHDYDPETGHEDVLEDTPRFLESQPEDDDLWFEQKPPKDFDLD